MRHAHEAFRARGMHRLSAPLPREVGPDDPEPKRFQTIELPPIAVEVTEYQAHARTCSCCGKVTHATIPAEIQPTAFSLV